MGGGPARQRSYEFLVLIFLFSSVLGSLSLSLSLSLYVCLYLCQDVAQAERESELALPLPFYSIQVPSRLNDTLHWREPSTILSSTMQMLISSRNTFTDTSRNNILPAIWACLSLVVLTHTISHHKFVSSYFFSIFSIINSATGSILTHTSFCKHAHRVDSYQCRNLRTLYRTLSTH